MDEADLKHLIAAFGEAPEGTRQMDAEFIKRCEEFDGDDPVRFLRDLRDDLVYAGGCSDFVISAISAGLSSHPESDEDMAARRRAAVHGWAPGPI